MLPISRMTTADVSRGLLHLPRGSGVVRLRRGRAYIGTLSLGWMEFVSSGLMTPRPAWANLAAECSGASVNLGDPKERLLIVAIARGDATFDRALEERAENTPRES